MDHNVDARKCGDRLGEQTLNVEIVSGVGAHGDDVAARGEDLLDRRFGRPLMLEVDDDDRPAPARQRPRDLAAGSRCTASDDRHHVSAEGSRISTIVAAANHFCTALYRGLPLCRRSGTHATVTPRLASRPRGGPSQHAGGRAPGMREDTGTRDPRPH